MLVHIENLVKRYGDLLALDHLSLDIEKGEIFGLLGPNGAGKTTTFKMLCGLLEVSEGELCVAGIDVRHAREKARELLGYMSQKFSLYPGLSVLENLTFFAGAYGLTGSRGKRRIAQVLQAFGLETFASRAAGTLPGGYKQRLSMACALLHSPDILFLDEPTSGADPLARRDFWLRINALAEKGVTIIITTHFLGEAEFCDNMLIMMDGTTLAEGSPDDIRKHALPREDGAPASLEDAFLAITEEHMKKGGET